MTFLTHATWEIQLAIEPAMMKRGEPTSADQVLTYTDQANVAAQH
jgi:hypothetical protein